MRTSSASCEWRFGGSAMRYEAREYQQRMSREILDGNCLLAAPPGLGKTAAALEAIDTRLFDAFDLDRALWVGPKIVVEDTVPNELTKWDDFTRIRHRVWSAPDFGYYRREDNKLRPENAAALREAVLSDPAHLHLVSRDNYYPFVLTLGSHWPYGLQVLDESWGFADLGSKRFQGAAAVNKHTDATSVLLNGTPIGNGLEKLWAQMLLVDGGATLGRTLHGFRLKFMEPHRFDPRRGKVFSWKPVEGAVDAIIELCRGRLVTLLEDDWVDVPELVPMPTRVEIPRERYKQMERDGLLDLEGGEEAVAVNAGVLYNKLLQIANGFVFDTEGGWHAIHEEKLEALREIREDHPGPLLIWAHFQPDVERIKRLFPKACQANRVTDLERKWNAGKIETLIAHPNTLAAGANLQDAPGSGMCWFGVTSNALHWNQGIKRLCRSGRKEPVPCYSIAARDTVEDAMLQLRMSRTAVETQVMEALAYRRRASLGQV